MSESPEPRQPSVNAASPPPPPSRPSLLLRLKAFLGALVSTRLDKSGGRIRQLALILCLAYAGIGAKLIKLGLSSEPPQTLKVAVDQAASGARPDLLDRNGQVLATDVRTLSVFAEPRRIIDKDEAVELITAVLPDVDAKELRERLGSLDAATLASADLEPLFRAKPAIHRFPAKMAERVHALAVHIDDRYDGDPARVWTDAADATQLRANLAALPGFGEMKVKSLGAVLAKELVEAGFAGQHQYVRVHHLPGAADQEHVGVARLGNVLAAPDQLQGVDGLA